jgi:hypothetical protein
MRRIPVSLVVLFAAVVTAMTIWGQEPALAQRSYIQMGEAKWELKPMSNDQAAVTWTVEISNNGNHEHTLNVEATFYDANNTEVLYDGSANNRVPANGKLSVSHTKVTDAKTANSIQRAEVSIRRRLRTEAQ